MGSPGELIIVSGTSKEHRGGLLGLSLARILVGLIISYASFTSKAVVSITLR